MFERTWSFLAEADSVSKVMIAVIENKKILLQNLLTETK